MSRQIVSDEILDRIAADRLENGGGHCESCGVMHGDTAPHYAMSDTYQKTFGMIQKTFGMMHQRAPTWEDALAHCSTAVARRWRKWLRCRFPNYPSLDEVATTKRRGRDASEISLATFSGRIAMKIRSRRIAMGYPTVRHAVSETERKYPGVIDYTTWITTERGDHEMRISTFVRFALVLGVPLSELLPAPLRLLSVQPIDEGEVRDILDSLNDFREEDLDV